MITRLIHATIAAIMLAFATVGGAFAAKVQLMGTRVEIEPLKGLELLPGGQALTDPGKLFVTASELSPAQFNVEVESLMNPEFGKAEGFREIQTEKGGTAPVVTAHAKLFHEEATGDFRKHIYLVSDGTVAAMVIVAIPRAVFDADTKSDENIKSMLSSVTFAKEVLRPALGFRIVMPSGFEPYPPGAVSGQTQMFVNYKTEEFVVALRNEKPNTDVQFSSAGGNALRQSMSKQWPQIKFGGEKRDRDQTWEFVELEGTTKAANDPAKSLAVFGRAQRDKENRVFICIAQGASQEGTPNFAPYRDACGSITID